MTDRVAFRKLRNHLDAPSPGKARTNFLSAACVVVWLLSAQAAFPASPKVGDILRKMGFAYSRLQNYHIVAVREDVLLQSRYGYSNRSVIELDRARPGRVRMSLTGDGPNVVIVCDGKTTWRYAPRKNEYTEAKGAPNLGEPAMQKTGSFQNDLLGQMENLLVGRFVKLWQFEKQAEFKGMAKVEFQGRKTPCYRIVFHLKGLTDRLWIDQSSYLVLQEKTVQTTAAAERRSLVNAKIRFTEIGTDATHPPGFFTFTPPANAWRVVALNLPGVRESFVGYTAENFTLKDIEGNKVSLGDYRGKTVLLSFWATWCAPCKEELPTLQKIFEERKDVVVLAVDDENRATVRNFLKEKNYSFTALLDGKRTLFKQFAVHFIPTIFVINGQGIIMHKFVGWEGPEKLLAALKDGGSEQRRGGPQGPGTRGTNPLHN